MSAARVCRPLTPLGWALALGGLLLTGCSAVGPDYQRPSVATPAQWQTEPGWQSGQPRDTEAKGDWWTVYGDPQLNALMALALTQNNTLALAQSRLDQARAQTNAALGARLPRVGLQGATSRYQTSANRPLTSYTSTNSSVQQNDYNLALTVSYEVDLAGRVRRQLEGVRASEAQSQADFENTRLLLGAQLASSYLALRGLDAEIEVLQQTLRAQRKTLDFVTARHELGSASGIDLGQQQGLLAGTEAQLQSLRDTRARFEHALATLTGQPAPSFKLPPSSALPPPPLVALGQPADLLERRPDIASAERAMAAANAQIGVASSAYFPSLTLSSLYGNDSGRLAQLFTGPSLLWSLGLSATQTLFDGGRTQAAVNVAQASHQQASAQYRQVVLVAFQEVQDGLSTQAALRESSRALQQAVAAAEKVLSLSQARYQAGASSLLEVVLAQQTLLGYQRQEVQNRSQQLLTSVQLIKALGGGWQVEPGTALAAQTPRATP
ncbi:efflux transporter outer membrane subunit [Curvibacter sp. HBC61]|uniref:Efflux transporter outer membrane subunit n=1 Tax=Curvibacter cyanobacteriorum TaxID=3026422 RepID=A0ABT5N0S9_9BURK|nr:efflux transporter outer membrane subunit [Curvibacter sp. HBC61]MDD0839922.1 efflux transporter outer membrane subunit [Curvibacter sp. HBC61]